MTRMNAEEFVVCESADGWSLHAPGSTDEDIASGDAPPLVSGPWEDDDQVIPASAYDAARRALSGSKQLSAPCASANEIARFERHARTSELGAGVIAAMTVLSVREDGSILRKRFSLIADENGGERRVESEWERWQRYSGDFALLEKSLAYSQYRLMALYSGSKRGERP